MNHNRHITLENSNIIVKYTNERIIPASGLAVVGVLLARSISPKSLTTLMLRLWTIQRLQSRGFKNL